MKRECAWCSRDLNPSSGEPGSTISSHGICPACTDNIPFQLGVTLDRFINALDVPTLLVDRDAAVQGANRKARSLFRIPTGEIAAIEGGIVFECHFSRLPQGCGRTIHCSGCAIRKAVQTTFATGEPQNHVEAILRKSDKEIRYLISTKRQGEFVALLIEDADNAHSQTDSP